VLGCEQEPGPWQEGGNRLGSGPSYYRTVIRIATRQAVKKGRCFSPCFSRPGLCSAPARVFSSLLGGITLIRCRGCDPPPALGTPLGHDEAYSFSPSSLRAFPLDLYSPTAGNWCSRKFAHPS
jgi:hypothetical protein